MVRRHKKLNQQRPFNNFLCKVSLYTILKKVPNKNINAVWPVTRKISISSVYPFKGEKFGQRKTEQFCIMNEKGV
jgi:hypothetical protein